MGREDIERRRTRRGGRTAPPAWTSLTRCRPTRCSRRARAPAFVACACTTARPDPDQGAGHGRQRPTSRSACPSCTSPDHGTALDIAGQRARPIPAAWCGPLHGRHHRRHRSRTLETTHESRPSRHQHRPRRHAAQRPWRRRPGPDPRRATGAAGRRRRHHPVHLREGPAPHPRRRPHARLDSPPSGTSEPGMAATPEMLAIALAHRPHAVCLVPRAHRRSPPKAAWTWSASSTRWRRWCALGTAGIPRVDIHRPGARVEPQRGWAVVELCTGSYAGARGDTARAELARLQATPRRPRWRTASDAMPATGELRQRGAGGSHRAGARTQHPAISWWAKPCSSACRDHRQMRRRIARAGRAAP